MKRMMNALVKTEKAKGLTLMQVPVPEPGMGEVLIKIVNHPRFFNVNMEVYLWQEVNH